MKIVLDMIQGEALQFRDIILNEIMTIGDRYHRRDVHLKPTLSASL